MMLLAAIVAGFLLDLLLGDPHWLPHPICLIGNFISFLEKRMRRLFGANHQSLLAGGALMVVIVLLASFMLPLLILYAAELVSPRLARCVQVLKLYQNFATKCFRAESMKVYHALKNNDLEDARLKLSWIVGRDTQKLTETEVAKAAVETVAENTSDGVIAPMLYMFIGGAPLAFLYKAINTMDSMVGYKNDKYRYFGRCAARLDDLANLLPARISGLSMVAAAFCLRLNAVQAWNIFWRDRYNNLSANSAMTESAAAGALNIQLGGGHYYFGQWVYKKTIGDDNRPVCPDDIVAANNLLYMTALIDILLFSCMYLLVL